MNIHTKRETRKQVAMLMWGLSKMDMPAGAPLLQVHPLPLSSPTHKLIRALSQSLGDAAVGVESVPLRVVHLSRHKWPGGLVN